MLLMTEVNKEPFLMLKACWLVNVCSILDFERFTTKSPLSTYEKGRILIISPIAPYRAVRWDVLRCIYRLRAV